MQKGQVILPLAMALIASPLGAQSAMQAGAQEAAAPATAIDTARYQRRAPAGAPNVVVVLLDDVGFGASSTFGGPIATPALDELATHGLRYNRFHTTAICSPTRAALLTGRNPHATGIGAVENTIDARPGYSGFHTKDSASIAEVLRQAGYATAAFGKWHQTADWESSPVGPFDRWPTGEGFDYFYGFMGGETDQFDPTLYEGTSPVMRPAGGGYHLTEDLVAHAAQWVGRQHALTPDRPFFLYFAPGATHAPLQAPRDWIDRYKGQFAEGWDRLREESFSRQKRLGVIPPEAELTPRNPLLPAWNSLTADQQRVAQRQMEVYAGFLAHTDAQVGKLIASLKAQGTWDNTLFFYIVGDNGASGEGGLKGSGSYMGAIQGMPETDAIRLAEIAQLGGPGTYPHYASGWAWAMDTPFPWMKTVASHLGATRNGLVVSWPRGIDHPGGLRSQFGHVNDIAPTILEAAHIAPPAVVNGISQKPIDGTSMIYSFNDPQAPERHATQYFEVFGHRAIYHDGWMASAFHSRLPWSGIATSRKTFDEDTWELYDLSHDFSQAHDLAAREPARLAAMKQLFLTEAARNQVLPLQNITTPDHPGLPSLAAGRKRIAYGPGAIGIPESALPRLYNTSYSVTARITVSGGARGVIAALGGSAGWSLWLDPSGRPVLSYRLFNITSATLRGSTRLRAGEHTLRYDFAYDGGGYGKGGTVRLTVDGQAVGSAHLPASPAALFTIDETFDVGIDRGSPVGVYPASAPPGYALAGARAEEVVIDAR